MQKRSESFPNRVLKCSQSPIEGGSVPLPSKSTFHFGANQNSKCQLLHHSQISRYSKCKYHLCNPGWLECQNLNPQTARQSWDRWVSGKGGQENLRWAQKSGSLQIILWSCRNKHPLSGHSRVQIKMNEIRLLQSPERIALVLKLFAQIGHESTANLNLMVRPFSWVLLFIDPLENNFVNPCRSNGHRLCSVRTVPL